MLEKLSIIVPTIGRPKYFPATIRSLLGQSIQDFELLVSDNASDPVVTTDYPDRVRLIRRSERLSFSTHFNACLQDASGEWCVFVSDDDLVAPNFAELIISAISSFPDASIIFPRQAVIGAEDFHVPPPQLQPIENLDSCEFIVSVMSGAQKDFYTAVSLVARRSKMLEFGGFPAYASGAHSDNYLWTMLSQCGSTTLLPVCMNYRVYSSSVGLSMPFKNLLAGTHQFEKDLSKKLPETPQGMLLYSTWLKANSNCLVDRWKNSGTSDRLSIANFRNIANLLIRFVRRNDWQSMRSLLRHLIRGSLKYFRTSATWRH